MMADLVGSHGELAFTIEVKRAATGETEVFNMVGKILPQPEENQNGSDTQHSS